LNACNRAARHRRWPGERPGAYRRGGRGARDRRLEFSGQFESSEQASSLLLWLSAGVVVAMFFMLATAFRSAPLAGLIMVNLPLALIGGVAGVFASGGVLSVASIIGLIALLGIAARNGIMLVVPATYYALHHREEPAKRAVV
jgi:Cu/Ag efflux pump CusA